MWIEIMPGETFIFPFTFIALRPGLYYLTFMSYTSEEEAHLTGEKPDAAYEYSWFAWRYLIVGETNIAVLEQSSDKLNPAIFRQDTAPRAN